MLVQCPNCKTTYKVSEDTVKGSAPSFRCSRCKHTFQLQSGVESSLDFVAEIPREGPDNNLTFNFEAAAPDELGPAPRDAALTPEAADAPTPDTRNLVAAADGAGADSPIAPNRKIAEAGVQSDEADKQLSYAGAPAFRESAEKVLNIEPYRDQRASVMPFLTLFALIIVLAAFVFAYQKIHPTAFEDRLASIPLLGPSVVQSDHLKKAVLLKSLETKFQTLQGNREALLLTGVAVNQNPIMIRNVQLAAQLFDQEGKEIERQTMWIGNAISLQLIRGMTAQDVADLQRLKPLKTFEIPPGDSVHFALVFLRPGKSLKDARCEVLSVEAA